MNGPSRIQVTVRPASALLTDYRSDPAATPPSLLVRFGAFHWFSLLMLVVCGGPMVGLAFANSSVAAVIVTLVVAYVLAAILFNRVEIQVDEKWVSSRLVPIPIWMNKRIRRRDVTHIVATQRIERRDSVEKNNAAYFVVAHSPHDQFAITRQLRTREEAVFVARALEQYLGLASSAALDGDGSEADSDD